MTIRHQVMKWHAGCGHWLRFQLWLWLTVVTILPAGVTAQPQRHDAPVPVPAEVAGDSAFTVAVLDFEAKSDAERELSAKVTPMVVAQLSVRPEIMLLERAEIDKALGEQALGLSGTGTPDTATKIGQLTGVQVLVTGRAFYVDNNLVVVAKILSTATGRVYGEMVTALPNQPVVQTVTELSDKIGRTIHDKAGTLVIRAAPEDDTMTKLAKQLEGKPRPMLSLNVTETDFGKAAVPDPAVQTELGRVLQKLGFELVDPKASARPADILITGDAFSEVALRKGSLVSAKGRVELKAVEAKSGKVLYVAARTETAVDIAEHIAGKAALEKAAVALAAELVPKLIP